MCQRVTMSTWIKVGAGIELENGGKTFVACQYLNNGKANSRARICWSITLFDQKKAYIIDVGGPQQAAEFLTKQLENLDMHGFFIYLMADNNNGVENFLTSSMAERFTKTILLNIRESAARKLIIDVFFKHYFSKNRRISTSILGSFVDKRFLPFNSSSSKITKYREAYRKLEYGPLMTKLWTNLI